jgi:hypothetical protein
MLRRLRKEEQLSAIYATSVDFCRIFQDDMNALHLLALLLTASHGQAEACFTRSLEDCFNSPPVFVEWARAWARRMVIINTIRLCGPRQLDGHSNMKAPVGGSSTIDTQISAVLSLPAFERFIFVMTVLERYSDQECSLLLDCSRREVHLARSRALEQIASQRRFDRRADVNRPHGHAQAEDSTSFISPPAQKV